MWEKQEKSITVHFSIFDIEEGEGVTNLISFSGLKVYEYRGRGTNGIEEMTPSLSGIR